MKTYFNLVYNRVYDFTTAGHAAYHSQQEKCIDKLKLQDNDNLLCIGVGTGHELKRITDRKKKVNIVAIDQSVTALKKAELKTDALDVKPELHLMDARHMEFPAASFDKVLCIHVMEFIRENIQATGEIFRVLRNGGRFAITYPASNEGPGLGLNLLTSNIRSGVDSPAKRFAVLLKSLARVLVGLLYIPLLFRRKRKPYSRPELEQIFGKLTNGNLHIEEDKTYQDFIVYGEKFFTEVATDASRG